jgi:drug/metabolite transporter (DMT)-like permease
VLGILIALASSAIAGWASVAQQRVASSVPLEDGSTIHLLGRLVRHPLWLVALAANMVAFALHAFSLDVGNLLTVEPVVSTSLLFALAIGAWWAHDRLPIAVWVAAAFLVGGVALFLVAGDPTDTGLDASSLRWLVAGLVVVPIAVGLAWFAYRRTGPGRAFTFGVVAGILFGAQASLTKAVTIDLGSGVAEELTNWKLYAVVLLGVAAFIMQQTAFQAGSIALSLPATVVLPPITAAVIAITVLGGSVNVEGLHGVWIALSVVAMVGGLVVIARAEAARTPT